MKRVHLFEFEDQIWFPNMLRKGVTDFLEFHFSKNKRYNVIAPLIKKIMDNQDSYKIVDLCSGAGGGINNIQKEVSKICGKNVNITLTDKYPNIEAFRCMHNKNKSITYIEESIDATNVPESLHGFRTLFTAFHHFRPDVGKKILQDAALKGESIGIFELAEKDILSILKIFIFVPIELIYMTLFKSKISFSKIFFTFIIPLIPFFIIFDGIVSILRVYTPDELIEIVKDINIDNYVWETGYATDDNGEEIGKIIYLIGYKNKTSIV